MHKPSKPYNFINISSALFMMCTLAWLTISAPFVYATQQQAVKNHQPLSDLPLGCVEEEAPNPITNGPEEKKPGTGTSLAEEFLQHHFGDEYFLLVKRQHYPSVNADTYIAFHGELISPPPDSDSPTISSVFSV